MPPAAPAPAAFTPPGSGPAAFTPPGSGPGGATPSVPPWELSHDTGPQPVPPAETEPEPPDGKGQADGDFKGLPRRVRQASLAPQLRGDLGDRRRLTSPADADTAVTGPTPEEMRATMAALQRGWQEGRSQSPGGGEPPWAQNPEGDPDAT
jgi:hypothetical protein